MTQVFIKTKHVDFMPVRQHLSDACYDVVAAETVSFEPGEAKRVSLGFSLELPSGWEAQIRGRSGMNARGLLSLLGTVDSGYRGEVAAVIINLSGFIWVAERGMRIAQMAIRPVPEVYLIPTDHLSESDRGTNGFGSTGT